MGKETESTTQQQDGQSFNINALEHENIQVPHSDFIANSTLLRDGQDLTIETNSGDTMIITNYFNADPAPIIEGPNGSVLTQNLVQSFLDSNSNYASNSTMTDESPVGAVEEINGEATVIRVDGTTELLMLGTPVFNGDVIETTDNGSVNILFIDETSMAVSENARMSIDNYDYQAETESGVTNFSVLRGVFVYTSGLIGRDDPDDVSINTPVGSIGIRGTIIAGKIIPNGESEITVIEGAIVVSNNQGNVTLSQQYESVTIGGFNREIEAGSVKSASDVKDTYGSVRDVTPRLFSSINDNAQEEQKQQEQANEKKEVEAKKQLQEEMEQEQQKQAADETKEQEVEIKREELHKELLKDGQKPEKEDAYKKYEVQSDKNHDESHINQLDQQQGHNRPGPGNYNDPNALDNLNNGNTATNIPLNIFGLNTAGAGVASLPPALTFDFGNDGVTDNIIGQANHTVSGQTEAGRVTINPTDASSPLHINNPSPSANEHFGSDVAFLGDFNGDGETDFIVGVKDNDNGLSNFAGAAFIFTNHSNHASGFSKIKGAGGSNVDFGKHVYAAGDLNGDGLTDVVIGDGDGINPNGYIVFGSTTLINQTESSDKLNVDIKAAGAAGDINGDGNDDFGISVMNGPDMVTYVVYGDQISGAGNMDLTWLNDSNNALKIVHQGGYQAGGNYQIHSLGDVDGDGYDDIQIGNAGQPQYTVYGGKNANDTDVVTDGDALDGSSPGSPEGQIFATANNQALVGDVNFYDGTRSNVSMRGGKSDNIFQVSNSNFKNIDGGNGYDTIEFLAGTTLDFSNVNFEQVSQIEELKFFSNSQTITLTEENLFNFLKSSDTNELRITGGGTLDLNDNAGSATTLSSLGFTDETGDAGTGYDHWSLGDYNVYIDDTAAIV